MAATLRSASQARVAARPTVAKSRAAIVCKAQTQEAAKQVSTAVAAAALAALVGFGDVQPAAADVAGLTPCSESKAYAKLQKKELKQLNKRLKQYEAGSAPALALEATIKRTENRFANYAKAGLLCGTDGLPHLIADPGLALRFNHSGEVFIPTFAFLYVAGYIGYVGRQYLQLAKSGNKPTEKEIIIDVPTAISLAANGWAWPLRVVQELRAGTLTEKAENITVSPR